LHSIDDGIRYAGMGRMSPPGQHIGRRQDVLRQTVFWLILSGQADGYGVTQQLVQASGYCTVHAVWIALCHASPVSL
jgi:hypothetical protein